MRLASKLLLSLLACGGGACSSTSPSTPAPAAATSLWPDAPEGAVVLGQGQTVSIAFTLSAGATATMSGPDGLELVVAPGKLIVHADYSVHGDQLAVVHLTQPGAGAPVDRPLPITVKPLVWKARNAWTSGPAAREHGSMWFDASANAALLFGGSGYSPQGTPLGDAWTLDLASGKWAPWQPKGTLPSAAASRRFAEIPGTHTGYLFGGYATGPDLNELYRVSYQGSDATFTQITGGSPPPARSLHAFAYDRAGARFVTFGGYAGGVGTILDDTWLLSMNGDAPSWSAVTTPTKPSARYGTFYGMDDANGRLLVWSGAQGARTVDPADDLWALDLTSTPPAWSRLDVAGDAPPGRRNGCFVFDPAGPRLLVLGGTADAATTLPGLWFLDARPGKERWTRVDLPDAPPLRSSSFGFVGPNGDLYCGFGNDKALYRDLTAIGY